jgi:hypothetical protein
MKKPCAAEGVAIAEPEHDAVTNGNNKLFLYIIAMTSFVVLSGAALTATCPSKRMVDFDGRHIMARQFPGCNQLTEDARGIVLYLEYGYTFIECKKSDALLECIGVTGAQAQLLPGANAVLVDVQADRILFVSFPLQNQHAAPFQAFVSSECASELSEVALRLLE